MDIIQLIWIICLGINIIYLVVDILIIEKKFEVTLGELICLFLFMIVASPMGTIVYTIGFFNKYSDKTLIKWKKK